MDRSVRQSMDPVRGGGGGGVRGGSVFSSHPILCPVVSLIITEVLDKQLRVKISDNNFE